MNRAILEKVAPHGRALPGGPRLNGSDTSRNTRGTQRGLVPPALSPYSKPVTGRGPQPVWLPDRRSGHLRRGDDLQIGDHFLALGFRAKQQRDDEADDAAGRADQHRRRQSPCPISTAKQVRTGATRPPKIAP